MKGKSINLFMWGFQPHFRFEIEFCMNEVMEKFGVSEAGAECLLVGARIPDHRNPNGVCVEPEDGKWPITLFEGLLETIETEVLTHPLQKMFYSDGPSMQDKPENIRRDAVRIAVQKAFGIYDAEHTVHSFAGNPAPVNDYYVVPVLQLPGELFERFHPLREPISDDYVTGHPSLIHAAVSAVLAEAYDELLRPDPGRNLGGQMRSSKEIALRAAESFMRTLRVIINPESFRNPNLFEQFNLISSLMYEGKEGTGRLFLTKSDSESVNMLLEFTEPISFREPRWCRKVLQMALSKTALIADCKKIFGLGTFAAEIDPWMSQNIFEIEFIERYHWRLLCGKKVLLVSRHGSPSLPQEEYPRSRLLDTFQRLFPKATGKDAENFISLYEAAVSQYHGSMLIIAEDAETEAGRLQDQGTRIAPTKLTPGLYSHASSIDGAIIIDPYGVCYAIGVILDGPAHSESTPSRGSRYNSGIRYVNATDTSRLAIVISDDGTADVVPLLRPQIKRSAINEAIIKLEAATKDNYHSAISWLDKHRFFLGQEQCDRINAALERIRNEPIETGEFRRIWDEFLTHPEMNDSYFESEVAN